MKLEMLFIASAKNTPSLEQVAERVFSLLEVSEREERFSENYTNGHYFVGYAENGLVEIYDGDDDMMSNYPFRVAVKDSSWRKASGTLITNPHEVAKVLAAGGLTVLVPKGAWQKTDWDGQGDVYPA